MKTDKPVIACTTVPSPIGPILLTTRGDGLAGVFTDAQKDSPSRDASWKEQAAPFQRAARELAEYFAGERRAFDVALDAEQGTAFQRDVWSALRGIPFGKTMSYAEVARRVGRPSAVRAVGAAVGKNPWGIVVPCHRVVGTAGALTGFAGGLARKRWLLEHEGLRVDGGKGADDARARVAGSAKA